MESPVAVDETPFIETKIVKDPADVARWVLGKRLSRAGLLRAAAIARNESANATAFHPANAAGTFGYQHGTFALRDQFVSDDDDGWVIDRVGGVESIRNDAVKMRVAFCNVDLACDDNRVPQPRSHKGSGAELASRGGDLFKDLPHYAPRSTDDWSLFYLMTDENGATELTRPVLRAGTFVATIERVYLSYGGDDEPAVEDHDDASDDFDPVVARK